MQQDLTPLLSTPVAAHVNTVNATGHSTSQLSSNTFVTPNAEQTQLFLTPPSAVIDEVFYFLYIKVHCVKGITETCTQTRTHRYTDTQTHIYTHE